MKIQWLGRSCFRLEESTGAAVITEPFSIKLFTDGMLADAVTFGGERSAAFDTPYGNLIVIDKEGAYEVNGIHISCIAAENFCGKGKNLVFTFRMDGVDIVYLGDVSSPCSIKLVESIGSCKVLLLPIGGGKTLNAEAAKDYVDKLMPDIVVPMRYRTKDSHDNDDYDKPDDFVELFDEGDVDYADSNEIEIDRTVSYDSTRVVILKNKNA